MSFETEDKESGSGKISNAAPAGGMPPAFGLVIDTSIVGVAVALVKLGQPALPPVWRAVHETNAGSLQQIAALAAKACAAGGLKPHDLAGVGVSTGPGSFTGIKVGLAFAYGLAAAKTLGMPLFGDSGLAAAAAALRQSRGGADRPIALFLPATRSHGFVATITATGQEDLKLVHAEAGVPSGPAHRAVDVLADLGENPLLAVAGTWLMLHERLGEAGRGELLGLSLAEAATLGIDQLAARTAAAWPAKFSTKLPEPRYLRLSTAEEKLAENSRLQVKSL